jgi:hypothetical protein
MLLLSLLNLSLVYVQLLHYYLLLARNALLRLSMLHTIFSLQLLLDSTTTAAVAVAAVRSKH